MRQNLKKGQGPFPNRRGVKLEMPGRGKVDRAQGNVRIDIDSPPLNPLSNLFLYPPSLFFIFRR